MLTYPTPSNSFGLSYTTFAYAGLKVSEPSEGTDPSQIGIDVTVSVTNTGKSTGSEVVQLYVHLAPSRVQHPSLQLRAFVKVHNITPGSTRQVKMHLDKYSVSFWDEPNATWRAEKGVYGVFVGSSSVDLPLQTNFELHRAYEWVGL